LTRVAFIVVRIFDLELLFVDDLARRAYDRVVGNILRAQPITEDKGL
jgi:hypothetical protein